MIIFVFLFKFAKFVNIVKKIDIMNSNIKSSIKIIITIKKNYKNCNNRENRENRDENRDKKTKNINKNEIKFFKDFKNDKNH